MVIYYVDGRVSGHWIASGTEETWRLKFLTLEMLCTEGSSNIVVKTLRVIKVW